MKQTLIQTLKETEKERYGLTVPCQILEGKEPHDVHIIWREGLGQPDQPGQESQTGGPGQQKHSACSRSDRSASLDEMSRVISMHFCTLFSEGAGAEVAKAHKRRDQGWERGIRILISSREMTAHEAAESLRKRIPAKIAFEALRSHPGKDGIGISPEEAMTGKEFIWLVTSILYALLLCGTEPLRTSDRKGFSLPEIVDDLEAVKADRNIRKNRYERRYRLTKRQAEILSCFDISEERLDEIIDLLNED